MQFALSRKPAPKASSNPSPTPDNPTPTGLSASTPNANASTHSPPQTSNVGSSVLKSENTGDNSSASSAASAAASASQNSLPSPSGIVQQPDAPAEGMRVSAADQRRIDEENQQLLKSMSPAQVG